VDATREALGAADATGALAATYLLAPPAQLPAAATALRERLGLDVTIVTAGELAAAHGALSTLDLGRRGRGREPLWTRLVAVAVPAASSVLLFTQQLRGSFRVDATSLNPQYLVTEWASWGLAALCVTLAGVAGVLLLAHLRPPGADPSHEDRARKDLVGYGLLVTASVSVVVVFVYAMIGASRHGVSMAPFLKAMLPADLPAAALVVMLGLAVPRAATPARVWQERLWLPTGILALGLGGTLAAGIAATGWPGGLSDLWPLLQRAGAAAVGVAVALLLVRRKRLQILVAPVLAAVAASFAGLQTMTAYTVILIVALTARLVLQVARIGLEAARRLVTSDRPQDAPGPEVPAPRQAEGPA
jgi:hypothetical protein